MRHSALIRAVGFSAATLVVGRHAQAQTACTTTGVTLRLFTPVDSLFTNSTATTFTIKLNNTVSGCASEYRVSRFADFRDATWLTYSAAPNTIVQRTWFPAIVNGATEVTLYFQVRQKNPKGGFPTSISGGKTQTQPDFFFSDVLGRRIRLIYFG
jgi:hypothetical protein